jgi:hypothetical protein
VFSTGGQRQAAWALPPLTGSLNGFACGPDGTLWLADADVIRHYREDGQLLAAWAAGNAVSSIAGLGVDGLGRVYVTDFSLQRIVRYQP